MPEAAAVAAPEAPEVVAPVVPAEGADSAASKPAETASATPTGDETKPTTPDPSAEKRGTSRFERRISRLHREAAEQKARADLLERQLTEHRQQGAAQADPAAPKLEQFKDIEEYASARAKYESEKTLKTHQEKQVAAQNQARSRAIASEWEKRVEQVDGKYEDFDAVVGELQPTNPFLTAVMEAGPEVAYHLGKNRDEAMRILKLSPLSQIREIGKLEARLSAEPQKPATPSKAPAPIKPLTGAAGVATDVPSDQDDMRTWFRKRQKQVHGKRA